jgi:hypothetical protein
MPRIERQFHPSTRGALFFARDPGIARHARHQCEPAADRS